MPQLFSPRADLILRQLVLAVVLGGGLSIAGLYYFASPNFTRVGYTPSQPVPFSHSLHAGQLGLDCRYCHTNVEDSPHATVPPTATCMNCHSLIKTESPLLSRLREGWDRDALASEKKPPIEWTRVHRLPDYAYFNHAAHVRRGVECQSCHGNVDEMKVVRHAQSLSMSWCLDCHRDPASKVDRDVTEKLKLSPPQSCQGCHR